MNRPVGVFIGLATLDVVQHVEELPRPNAKVTATWQGVAAGGPALNAAVTFAALGGDAHLLTRVGSGPIADLIRADLADCGVRVVDAAAGTGYVPALSAITVHTAGGDRQIVSTDAGAGEPALDRERVSTEVGEALRGADVVEVDGHHPDLAQWGLQSLQSTPRAQRHQGTDVPRVLDAGRWKPPMAWLVGAVTDVIASADFTFPEPADGSERPDVLTAALAAGAEFAAVSAGAGPLRWMTRTAQTPATVQPPHLAAVDTLGAGDVLHGAYCYARAAWPTADPGSRLRFAADVAARSCTERGTRTWLRGLGDANLPAP